LLVLAFVVLALYRDARVQHPRLSTLGSRLYQIGLYNWKLRTPNGVNRSIEYFRQVVATDPQNALGYTGLAFAYAILGDYGYGPEPQTIYFARARSYARIALAIDPQSADAYAVMGMLGSTKYVRSRAEIERSLPYFERALSLDRNNTAAHQWYGFALLQLGRLKDARAQLQQASQIDPLSVATLSSLANLAYLERRYEEVIGFAQQTLDVSPKYGEAYRLLGLAYEGQGDHAAAVATFRRMAAVIPAYRMEAAALLADEYARSRRPAQMRAELRLAQSRPNDLRFGDLAIALASSGRIGEANAVLRTMRNRFLGADFTDDPRAASLLSGSN
jgi:tetratricopeptide (TPR) repeat protein